MSDRATFHNNLRILMSLDHQEVPFLDGEQWHKFRTDPFRFFIRCDDDTCAAIWVALLLRQPKPQPIGNGRDRVIS